MRFWSHHGAATAGAQQWRLVWRIAAAAAAAIQRPASALAVAGRGVALHSESSATAATNAAPAATAAPCLLCAARLLCSSAAAAGSASASSPSSLPASARSSAAWDDVWTSRAGVLRFLSPAYRFSDLMLFLSEIGDNVPGEEEA